MIFKQQIIKHNFRTFCVFTASYNQHYPTIW